MRSFVSLSLFVTCVALLSCGVGRAQDTKAIPKSEQSVRLISQIIKEHDESKKVQVKDFVLDLETGHVALQILSWQHGDAAKPVIAISPFSPKVDVARATKLAKELSSTDPSTLNRKLAATLHSTFGQDVYWSKYITRLQPDGESKFDRENYELVPFATIKNKKIVDIDGELLGKLIDVGVREVGDIAYCVLQSTDGKLRAIPLGAFLDRERNKDWKIELKRDQVFQFKPFDAQQTPQEIDRGWQEYVAVRYGRDSLQEVPKAKPEPRSTETKDK